MLLNVRLASDHMYGKLLFTWLLLAMSMIVSSCAVLLSWMGSWTLVLIESVSEGFPTYSLK